MPSKNQLRDIYRRITQQTGGKLWIPVHQVSNQPPRMPGGIRSMMLLYATYEELTSIKATPSDLIKAIIKTHFHTAIRFTAVLSVLLHNERAFSVDHQAPFVNILLSPELRERFVQINIERGQEEPRSVLVFEHQLLTLTKYLLLFGESQGKSFKKDEYVKALLMAGDLGESEFTKQLDENVTVEQENRKTFEAMIRSLLFSEVEDYRSLIVRYYHLFVTLPRQYASTRELANFDIERQFESFLGITPEEYIVLGLVIVSKYFNVRFDNIDGNSLREVALDRKSIFAKLRLPRRRLSSFLKLVASTPDQFNRDFNREWLVWGSFYYGYKTMRDRPLLLYRKQWLIPVSQRFLEEKVTSGIYWSLHQVLSDNHPKLLKRYSEAVGFLFERYVEHLLASIYPPLSGRLHKEREYNPVISDFAIVYVNSLVLIEVVSSRLLLETRTTGNRANFERGLDKVVYKKARQLSKVAQNILDGRTRMPGLNRHSIDEIWPVIVTIEPFPEFPIVRSMIEQEIKKRKLLQQEKVRPLQIISIDELEMLGSLIDSGKPLLELLREKIADSDYYGVSMRNFLHERHYNALRYTTENGTMLDELFDKARQFFTAEEQGGSARDAGGAALL